MQSNFQHDYEHQRISQRYMTADMKSLKRQLNDQTVNDAHHVDTSQIDCATAVLQNTNLKVHNMKSRVEDSPQKIMSKVSRM